MCGGFFGFSLLLKPSNSLTLRPSCATEMRAPLQASWRGAAADRDEAVAVVLLVQRHRVHDVVVLGVGLDLVVDHDLEAVVLHRLDDLVDDVGAAQARRHHQRLLEAQLEGLRADHLMRARAHHRPGERVELLDGERLEPSTCMAALRHGNVLTTTRQRPPTLGARLAPRLMREIDQGRAGDKGLSAWSLDVPGVIRSGFRKPRLVGAGKARIGARLITNADNTPWLRSARGRGSSQPSCRTVCGRCR